MSQKNVGALGFSPVITHRSSVKDKMRMRERRYRTALNDIAAFGVPDAAVDSFRRAANTSSWRAFLSDIAVVRAAWLPGEPVRLPMSAGFLLAFAADQVTMKRRSRATLLRYFASVARLHQLANTIVPITRKQFQEELTQLGLEPLDRRPKAPDFEQLPRSRYATADKLITNILSGSSGPPSAVRDRALLAVAVETGLTARQLVAVEFKHLRGNQLKNRFGVLADPRPDRRVVIWLSANTTRLLGEWLKVRGKDQGVIFFRLPPHWYGAIPTDWPRTALQPAAVTSVFRNLVARAFFRRDAEVDKFARLFGVRAIRNLANSASGKAVAR